MQRLAKFGVLAGSTVVGFQVGVRIPDSQYTSTHPNNLETHPYVEKLLKDGWKPHHRQLTAIPGWHRNNMALSGILSGEDKFDAAPISLSKGEEHQTIFSAGPDLATQKTGFWKSDNIIRGMVITMFDHNLAQTACGRRRALTHTLDVEFLNDVPSGILALQSTLGEKRSRSSKASGTMHQVVGDQLGPALARGEVLMVRPKWAAWM